MSDRLRASLIGGAIMGVLSAVTAVPQIPFLRLLCCLWAIVGGVITAYLYVKRSPKQVSIGDGAIAGLLAGVFGTILSLIAFLLVSFYVTDRALAEEQMRRFNLNISYTSLITLAAAMAIILQLAQAVVGGIIGVAIFERRGEGQNGPPPPPPPPSYPYTGGTPGEAYAPSPAPPAATAQELKDRES